MPIALPLRMLDPSTRTLISSTSRGNCPDDPCARGAVAVEIVVGARDELDRAVHLASHVDASRDVAHPWMTSLDA